MFIANQSDFGIISRFREILIDVSCYVTVRGLLMAWKIMHKNFEIFYEFSFAGQIKTPFIFL